MYFPEANHTDDLPTWNPIFKMKNTLTSVIHLSECCSNPDKLFAVESVRIMEVPL